jgi:hypothetical protein
VVSACSTIARQLRSRWWSASVASVNPRWASRITLDVTGVRVERLQDIEEDARRVACPSPRTLRRDSQHAISSKCCGMRSTASAKAALGLITHGCGSSSFGGRRELGRPKSQAHNDVSRVRHTHRAELLAQPIEVLRQSLSQALLETGALHPCARACRRRPTTHPARRAGPSLREGDPCDGSATTSASRASPCRVSGS